MGMMGHRRTPGVQEQAHPEAGPRVFWISGNREQGLGGGLEQDTIEDRVVVPGEVTDRPALA